MLSSAKHAAWRSRHFTSLIETGFDAVLGRRRGPRKIHDRKIAREEPVRQQLLSAAMVELTTNALLAPPGIGSVQVLALPAFAQLT